MLTPRLVKGSKFLLPFVLFIVSVDCFSQSSNDEQSKIKQPQEDIVVIPVYSSCWLTVTVTEGMDTPGAAKMVEDKLKGLQLFQEIFVSFDRKQVELKIGDGPIGISHAEIFKVFMLANCKIDKNIIVKSDEINEK